MGHSHEHDHGHTHDHVEPADLPAALDLSIPDGELAPGDVSRRGFLRRAGVLGAGAGVAAAASGVVGGAFALPELAKRTAARGGAAATGTSGSPGTTTSTRTSPATASTG